ncbi:hypothetical protein [Pasteurella atlantica]|uniref:hypothetical protein n=1 Tax=Pasteurella atlantica TaxID=2827233 RepID=UPI00278BC8C6|nr:hypothetical protein [Pasteurella atlantica]MDP8133445.1 hypothetical protein [Pasteurella atlantica]
MCYTLFSAVSTVTENDADADGTPEVIKTELDTDGDGKVDTVTVAKDLDDDGTVDISRTTVDMDGNDTPEKVIVTTKDAITGEIVETTYIDENQDGKPDRTIVSVDKDHDGTFETVTESTTERDGTKITKEFINTDDEGALDEVVVTIEHPNKTVTTETGKITEGKEGNLVIDYDVDKYSNGKAISGRTDTLDKDGNVLKSEYDVNNDGTTDSITTREFDKLGNNTVENIDKNADGKTEVIKTNKFDEQGNAIKTDVDLNADGKTDKIITREFDKKGNPTKVSTDLDADGTPDKSTTNEFNEKNQLVKSSNDLNNDGTPDNITENEYDIYGNRVKSEYDYNADGTVDMIDNGVFDDKGNQIRIVRDTDGDGTIDRIYHNSYDDKGILSSATWDTNADGKADDLYNYVYLHKENSELFRIFTYDATPDDGINNPVWYIASQFDDKGNIIEERKGAYYEGVMEHTDIKEVSSYSTTIYERDIYGNITERTTYRVADGETIQKVSHGLNSLGATVYEEIDSSTHDRVDGNADKLFVYKDFTISNTDHLIGLQNIDVKQNNIEMTISDDVLDKITNDDNSHKVIVNSKKSGDVLNLDGNFVKTTDTEAHDGQDYVKYTDDAGNALIVDPDVTVNII